MSMYKIINDDVILRKADNAFIPANAPGNVDYLEYEAWLAEGNIPEYTEEEAPQDANI